jgi:propanol-preferring alcohol dehydrogenase
MKARTLHAPAPIETRPLRYEDVPVPTPGPGEVLIRVHACGVCRTDLHVIEGELPTRNSPVIPGHQVVGVIEGTAQRVGVPWLHRTCGVCEFCRSGRENLCESASFTGYTVNGGYAEYIVAPKAFVYPIPDGFADLHAAPLLCAGIIGFRCLRLAQLSAGAKLGIYGFGAAGHVAIQVARHWGLDVYVMTRDERHRKLGLELGAVFAGGTVSEPPDKLDAAVVFAPAGEIVPAALKALKRGGNVVLGGIHMSPIPSFDYNLIYWERSLRSVANNTREDGQAFLKVAAEIPIHTSTQVFPLTETNEALNLLKNDAVRGAAVIEVSRE